jgi:hypothetical protein
MQDAARADEFGFVTDGVKCSLMSITFIWDGILLEEGEHDISKRSFFFTREGTKQPLATVRPLQKINFADRR